MFVLTTPTASADGCTYTNVGDAGVVMWTSCEYAYAECGEGSDGYYETFDNVLVVTPAGTAVVQAYDFCHSSAWSNDMYTQSDNVACFTGDAYVCAGANGYTYTANGGEAASCTIWVGYGSPVASGYQPIQPDQDTCYLLF